MKIDEADKDANTKVTDLEHMFSVFIDRRGNYSFNLNETVYLSDVRKSELPHLTIDHDYYWTTISYRIYGTTRLAWLLMKVNGVRAENIFDIVPRGTAIYYLERGVVNELIQNLRDY